MPEQSLKNHTRFDPPFHFFLAPVVLVNLGLSIYYTLHQWPLHSRSHLWWCVMALAFLVALALLRAYPLKVQDRVIRLEERLRMARLLSPAELDQSHSLTLKQVVALRFASDAELPALVRRTVTEGLAPRAIKAAITSWRPDHDRV
jgi:hypothetical protein